MFYLTSSHAWNKFYLLGVYCNQYTMPCIAWEYIAINTIYLVSPGIIAINTICLVSPGSILQSTLYALYCLGLLQATQYALCRLEVDCNQHNMPCIAWEYIAVNIICLVLSGVIASNTICLVSPGSRLQSTQSALYRLGVYCSQHYMPCIAWDYCKQHNMPCIAWEYIASNTICIVSPGSILQSTQYALYCLGLLQATQYALYRLGVYCSQHNMLCIACEYIA